MHVLLDQNLILLSTTPKSGELLPLAEASTEHPVAFKTFLDELAVDEVLITEQVQTASPKITKSKDGADESADLPDEAIELDQTLVPTFSNTIEKPHDARSLMNAPLQTGDEQPQQIPDNTFTLEDSVQARRITEQQEMPPKVMKNVQSVSHAEVEQNVELYHPATPVYQVAFSDNLIPKDKVEALVKPLVQNAHTALQTPSIEASDGRKIPVIQNLTGEQSALLVKSPEQVESRPIPEMSLPATAISSKESQPLSPLALVASSIEETNNSYVAQVAEPKSTEVNSMSVPTQIRIPDQTSGGLESEVGIPKPIGNSSQNLSVAFQTPAPIPSLIQAKITDHPIHPSRQIGLMHAEEMPTHTPRKTNQPQISIAPADAPMRPIPVATFASSQILFQEPDQPPSIEVGLPPIASNSVQSSAPLNTASSATIHSVPINTLAQAIEPSILLRDSGGKIDVTLKPEDLGRLTVKIEPTANGTQIIFTAERAETQDLMRRQIDMLQQQFKNLGHENLTFSFSSNEHDARNTPPQGQGDEPRNTTHSEEDTIVSSNTQSISGGLDIRI